MAVGIDKLSIKVYNNGMNIESLTKRTLPQNHAIEVLTPNYKEPILPVSNGFGWYGLQSYNEQGQLMCHECGGFWDALGHHAKRHKLTANQYRYKYGLMKSRKLVSKKTSENMRTAYAEHPEVNKIAHERFMKIRSLSTRIKEGTKGSPELFNNHDSCPAQLLRKLKSLSNIYGENISKSQVDKDEPRLIDLLVLRFGSFNKAKQLLRLEINAPICLTKYPKQLILEDMICFYRKNKRWARKLDYYKGLMVCSFGPILRNGGLPILRKEAIQLKDEQDKRKELAKDVSLYAAKIEMESAGRAKV